MKRPRRLFAVAHAVVSLALAAGAARAQDVTQLFPGDDGAVPMAAALGGEPMAEPLPAVVDAPPTADASAPIAAPAAEFPAATEPSSTPPAPEDPLDDDLDEVEQGAARDALAPPDPAEKQTLEDRLKSLDGAGLSEEDKRQATEFYHRALKSFDVAAQQLEAAAGFKRKLLHTQQGEDGKGKNSTADYLARLERPLPIHEEVTGLPLAEIEKRAATAEASLAHCREELAAMIAEPKRRSQRMAELPGQISEAQQRLASASEELMSLGSEDAADVVAMARRAALRNLRGECKATLHALECEQAFYAQSADWVTTRRDYYARYVPHKEKRLAQLREIISRLREQETQQQAQRAAAEAAEAIEIKRPQLIIELANENKVLADERTALVDSMNRADQDADATIAANTQLKTQYDSAKARAEKLSQAGGQLLREQQAKLPNLRDLQRRFAAREPLLSAALLRTYELMDDSSELANLDDVAERLATEAGHLNQEARDELRRLLETKRDTLKRLIADYEKYTTDLNALHSEEAKLIELTTEYADFIAARVLWIRSCAAPARTDVSHAVHALAWSFDPHNWVAAGRAALHSAGRRPAQFVLGMMGISALGLFHRTVRQRLRELGEEARKRGCTRLTLTFHALWLTALVALPWPSVLGFLGWTMDPLSESDFVRSLGTALRFSAVCLLLIELSRQICRRGGLAQSHFDWSETCLMHVRRKLRWLALGGTPLVLWLVGLETQSVEPYWSTSLGRALFIAVMLLLSAVFHRLLLAQASPFRQVVLIRGGWLAPVRVIWRPAVVLLPAVLAGLALAGFYYTAQQAAVRILQTVAMLLAVVTLGGVTRRWLLVSRRRLAREQAKHRRAQLAAAADDDPASLLAADLADDAVDLAALSEQTQKLVRTFLTVTMVVGLVLIWGEILPALQYPAKQLLPGAEALTWGQLVKFLLILAVTYAAVRDVPALVELVILQHLPLDSGSRYAFTSMSRYVLAAIGLTAAFNTIGGEWAKIQWLVAAMSVGLGFGLQEIFANFVSGIILLFERPIRVGDVVTLGDKTGVVNRIRMRATTIVDPDRKEYIVPNKDLVTERLLNWTLTDPTNRVEVVVNVASGSDTDLACALLLEAAREQPHVLAEPQPSAVFEGFTDNGLKLALRCFLPNLENRGSTIHNLHSTIDRKFRDAGIEGAFADMRVRVARETARGAMSASRTVALPSQAERQGAA